MPAPSPSAEAAIPLMSRAFSVLPAVIAAGYVGTLVLCGYFPLSPGQESLWSGASSYWGCLQGVLAQELLWRHLPNGVSWMGKICRTCRWSMRS